MPLGFQSLSHGDIAFGFFNVQSDMLLLEHYFFFADDFCRKIAALEDSHAEDLPSRWKVWHIANRSDMGDYRSFLGQKRDVGFWGELYRLYPYPENPAEFHQQAEGWKTQAEVARIIGNYGALIDIAFHHDADKQLVCIGEYCFSYPVFKALILYVWVGGYPKWQDGIRPDYVMQMKDKIAGSAKPFFSGINFAMP